jgi:hypothetical protein
MPSRGSPAKFHLRRITEDALQLEDVAEGGARHDQAVHDGWLEDECSQLTSKGFHVLARGYMNPELKDVAERMKDLGLGALTHALRLSLYCDPGNPSWGDLSVLNAAHAAEILIKARLATEHPLLIFTQIPKSTQAVGAMLDFEDLFARGQTIDFQDLPERLWAATGIRLPNLDVYARFGKLRNAIQHFAPPTSRASTQTLKFIFRVLDPFIFQTWGLYAIDFNEEYGDHYEHIFDTLVCQDIRPMISPEAARVWSNPDYRPGKGAPRGYAKWFKKAMADALVQNPQP